MKKLCIVFYLKNDKRKICRTMFEYDVYYSNVMYNNAQIENFPVLKKAR